MNKELTPLEAYKKVSDYCREWLTFDKELDIIETALKALEIIKDKISWNFAIKYWWENHEINDEEKDLLKEVLL